MKSIINFQHMLRVAVLALISVPSTPASAQYDSAQYPRIDKPVYFGYEIGAGGMCQTLTSNIPQLQHLPVPMQGATVGVKLANTRGALRAHGGLYYSGGAVPYSIDMVSGEVSGNLYLLRLKNVVYHTFEPYALVSLTYQQTKFFGTYLNNTDKNRSISEEPELGQINMYSACAGAGVEFQLENATYQFIHFFAEVKYGFPMYSKGSNPDFSNTQINTPFWFTVGLSFGKFK